MRLRLALMLLVPSPACTFLHLQIDMQGLLSLWREEEETTRAARAPAEPVCCRAQTIERRGCTSPSKVCHFQQWDGGRARGSIHVFIRLCTKNQNDRRILSQEQLLFSRYCGVELIFVQSLFQKRTADTYDAETEKRTHRTKMVEKGVIFTKHVAETSSDADGSKTTTRIKEKGFIFPKKIAETDKNC